MSVFIQIARYCLELGNFGTLLSLISGFQLWCMSRLSTYWATHQDPKWSILLQHLSVIMSPKNNYAQYRKLVAERRLAGRPCLPYMGLLQKDLLFIEDANSDPANKTHLLGVALEEFAHFKSTSLGYVQKYPLEQLVPQVVRPPVNLARLFFVIACTLRAHSLFPLQRLSEDDLERLSGQLRPVHSAAATLRSSISSYSDASSGSSTKRELAVTPEAHFSEGDSSGSELVELPPAD
jgi:hypothetical protein